MNKWIEGSATLCVYFTDIGHWAADIGNLSTQKLVRHAADKPRRALQDSKQHDIGNLTAQV